MDALPESLRAHLIAHALGGTDPVWIEIDATGVISTVAGPVELLTERRPAPGMRAEEALPVLQGMLPLRDHLLVVPRLAVGPERYVDLHLLRTGQGTSLLAVEVTAATQREQAMLQRVNELQLQVARRPDAIPARALSALGLVALEGIEDDLFRVTGSCPTWSSGLLPEEPFHPGDALPFLESFLPEADELWQSGGGQPLRSGTWIQELADGAECPLEAVALPAGDGRRIMLVERQDAAHEERQDWMQRARDRALAHDLTLKEMERREVLVHCIVHDLKGPLTSIVGSLSLLEGGALSESDRAPLVDMARRQALKQDRMIRDLLDVFAHEGSATPGTSASVDLLACAREAVEGFQPAARERGLPLRLAQVAGDEGWEVRGEASRLLRVFANLIENALRHTRAGGAVEVLLERTQDGCTACVDNDGPIIPGELRDRLFDRFVRGAGGSTGIGLFFCGITVKKWGGEIAYEPLPERPGSRFRVTLPRVAPAGGPIDS